MITKQLSAGQNREGTCKARENVKTVSAEFFEAVLRFFENILAVLRFSLTPYDPHF